jgi:hypothetical protein
VTCSSRRRVAHAARRPKILPPRFPRTARWLPVDVHSLADCMFPPVRSRHRAT